MKHRGYQQGNVPPGRKRSEAQPTAATAAPPADLAAWREALRPVIEGGQYERLVSLADALGQELRDQKVTTSQVRQVFGELRRIELRWHEGAPQADAAWARSRLLMLKPLMAYQVARAGDREKRQGLQRLKDALDAGVELAGADRERFARLMDFFEAALAYHRYYGGK